MNKLLPGLMALLVIFGCKTQTIPEVAAPPYATDKGLKTVARPRKAAVEEVAIREVSTEKPEEKKIEHAAVGAKIKASSTHTGELGEGPARNLVDGKMTTRWSSEYAEPQQITIDLGKQQTVKKVRLYWEDAAATKYSVSVSPDGKNWSAVGEKTAKGLGPRTDEFKVKDQPVQSIRLDLQSRVNTNWGFSLYEVEVMAD